MDFSREFRVEGDDVVVVEQVALKKAIIPISDIRTGAFARMQEEIEDCMQPFALIFK